jgi:hypothetical protein
MKRAGFSFLPIWRWTASDDKALIQFIRRNPLRTDDYWDRAGAVVGARHPWRCYIRAAQLRREGAPIPIFPPRPKSAREREAASRPRTRVWTAERFALLLSLCREHGCVRAAAIMGTTVPAVYSKLRDLSKGKRAPSMPRVTEKSYKDDDVALAARAWAEFEKGSN